MKFLPQFKIQKFYTGEGRNHWKCCSQVRVRHHLRALCAVDGPCKLQLKTASDPRMYVFFGIILCINPLFESTEIVWTTRGRRFRSFDKILSITAICKYFSTLENYKSFPESSSASLLGFSFEIVRQRRAGQRLGVAYSAKFIDMSNIKDFI